MPGSMRMPATPGSLNARGFLKILGIFNDAFAFDDDASHLILAVSDEERIAAPMPGFRVGSSKVRDLSAVVAV